MREINIFIVTTVKFIELMFMILVLVAIIVTFSAFEDLKAQFYELPKSPCGPSGTSSSCFEASTPMVGIYILFVFFHILHTNLLVNLRLKLYTSNT
jgi:hypothetical protein